MNVLVFDIETIPDVEGGRRIYDLGDLSDDDAANAMFNLRRQENGTEFLRLHLQRIVAISAVVRTGDRMAGWSLGDETADENDILRYHRALFANLGILEWWRLRSTGDSLPSYASRRPGTSLLGNRSRG